MSVIYLSGPINGKDDGLCRAWRNSAASSLKAAGHAVLDPMGRDYRGREEESAEEIVSLDKEDIESSEVVLVNANSPGWGTAMECLYAISMGKRVVVFATHASAPSISPWLRCHSHAIFDSLDSAIAHIAYGSATGTR